MASKSWWRSIRESNPRPQLGKLIRCHYANAPYASRRRLPHTGGLPFSSGSLPAAAAPFAPRRSNSRSWKENLRLPSPLEGKAGIEPTPPRCACVRAFQSTSCPCDGPPTVTTAAGGAAFQPWQLILTGGNCGERSHTAGGPDRNRTGALRRALFAHSSLSEATPTGPYNPCHCES